MKRALLLTYHVPPRQSIATVRVGQLISMLARFGWEVVPVTPDLGDVIYPRSVVTTGVVDFKSAARKLIGVKKDQTTSGHLGVERGFVGGTPSLKQQIIRIGHDVTEYANRQFGWIGPGTQSVGKLLREQRFNAIISTSPPETTHQVASRVHGDIPWIADLRDPWIRENVPGRLAPLNSIDRLLEPRALRSAAAITTVSEPLAEELRKRYPLTPVYSIPNAFSNADWDGIPFAEPLRATFLYAGQLYGGLRDPRPFFAAISEALRERLVSPDEMVVEFYGDNSEWLTSEIRRHGIGSVVRVHGARPRSEILRLEREASRLLLFLWNDPNERGTYTGKLFEYLGARRRILAVGGPSESVVDEALHTSGAGERLRSVKGLRDAVVQAVQEWRTGATPIVEPHAVEPFESTRLGERFAAILNDVTSARAGSVR